jgi:phosphoglycerol transferase MdoB-like AlkP superfamily enzyme
MLIRSQFARNAPLTIRWLAMIWVVYLAIFTTFRIITVILFKPSDIVFGSLLPAFWMGFRFDARWISLLLLPMGILSIYPKFSPFFSEKNKKRWSWYLAITTFIVLFFFGADIANFSYNHTRINASALNFAEDPVTSIEMLWESYPLFWITLFLVSTVLLFRKLFNKAYIRMTGNFNYDENTTPWIWQLIAIFFMVWCVFGVFGTSKRLEWEDAFRFNDNFKSYVALNPFENFFTTLQFRKPSTNREKVKDYYPIVADFLQLDSATQVTGSYTRQGIPDSKALESKPNVVLVICESFSMYKSSMSGNPLNTTPFFKSLCDSGLFFDRCFSPTFGTARGVFAILTGTPDVQLSEFSSRDPAAVTQRTIINDFTDYQKYYFLGGNSDFNNFEGLVKNVDSIHIYQEGDYTEPNLNVWGISDKDLFMEAEKVLSKQPLPFFAIIQTADNHRPYTIPLQDADFEREEVNDDTLSKYGFGSLEEFQSFRYTDYCFKKFIQKARTEPWFNNTIFVFVGDHGLEGNANSEYPEAWTSARLTDEHIPLLFYAPQLISPEKRHEVVSQVDVLPTLAGMLQISYTNTTLGRDLLHSKNKMDAAFIIHHDEGNIGIVTDQYYFVKNLRISKEELWPIKNDGMQLSGPAKDSVEERLSTLTSAIYETAKYLLVNNKK